MALTDPDKFGLLIQCRAKMDELNSELLEHYSQFVISLLSTAQLKSLLFTGLNAIKHHVASNQLIQMKSTLNELIQNEKKAKTKKRNQNQTPSKNAPTILIVRKNASKTKKRNQNQTPSKNAPTILIVRKNASKTKKRNQ
eukprot:261879_1